MGLAFVPSGSFKHKSRPTGSQQDLRQIWILLLYPLLSAFHNQMGNSMLRRFILITFFCFTSSLAAHAQVKAGLFANYTELRTALDAALTKADITTALRRFDAGVTSEGQTIDVQRQFDRLFPNGLPNTALVRRETYGGGISRELLVYWNDTKYLWASVLIHDRGSEVVSIEFSVNTDYDTIAGQF